MPGSGLAAHLPPLAHGGDGDGVTHDLFTLLSSDDRDFLLRNNGDQVKISTLTGKILGLYFSGSWCRFTPKLVEVYQELASKGDFEVVFISSNRNKESFDGYLSDMPWLAIPFSDLETRKGLKDLFKVRGVPQLVVIDANGKVSTDQGTKFVMEYGVDGYPFTAEKINLLKEQEKAAKKDQSLTSLLVSSSRDYLISGHGKMVSVSELEGKIVGLYFSLLIHKPCRDFTRTLENFYKNLKEKGENFEIVLISLDYEEGLFKQGIAAPWLALPIKDKNCEKLARYFELQTVPTLVITGQDGKTLHPNVTELIEEHGVKAYPFSVEKVAELAEIEKARLEAQTLESLLVAEDTDFVIETSGSKVPVSELVGKHILLYFSAHWCPPCRSFLPTLITAYHEIKAKDNAFEIIFISSDRDQSSFDDFFSSMPWLALPFSDPRKTFLWRKFKIQGIPAVVSISPSGKTITTTARNLIQTHGADAFPFTKEHLKRLEYQKLIQAHRFDAFPFTEEHLKYQIEQEPKWWPEKVKSELHAECELRRTRRHNYGCGGSRKSGGGWSFHPKCSLKSNEATNKAKEGYVCDGDLCRKA